MPGILAMTSFPNRTSPSGAAWVLEQVLVNTCRLPAKRPGPDKQDQQRGEPDPASAHGLPHERVCANCHKILDPIGFGLRTSDATGAGAIRTMGGAIDAVGAPGGKHFRQRLKTSSPREPMNWRAT
jgi:hypothetical protein